MKKFLLIGALLAALALVVTGCPTGGGDDPDKPVGDGDLNWYLTDTEGGDKVSGNKITLTENCNVYVYFDAPGVSFDKIKLTYTIDPGQNLTYAAVYDTFGEGENSEIHTWGITNWKTDWLGGSEDIIVEINPSDYGDKWSGGTQNGRDGIDRTKIFGLCINFNDITTGVNPVFALKNVELTGKGSAPPPPPPPPGTLDVEFKGTKKSATLESSNFAKTEDGKLIVTWNPADDPNATGEKGAFRAKVQFAAASQVDLSSGYSKFKMDWTTTGGTGGSFNISLYFPSNRMLSAYAASGTAAFDFTSDHPSWAAGTTWGGAAVGTITGFEIYSNDTSIGAGPLVITKIYFE